MFLGQTNSDGASNLWNAALTVPTKKTKGKQRIKKSDIIHYPEFEMASQNTTDEYWKGILLSCAKKKLPRGFSYDRPNLYHQANNVYIVLPDDINALTMTAIYFFQENGKLYSEADQERRKRIDEEAILVDLANKGQKWSTVAKSKNRRAMHIRDYVENIYSHLTQEVRNELFTQINVGFETGFINKDHISFEDGQVVHVDGLDADENGVIFTRTPVGTKLSTITRAEEEKPKPYRHYDNWTKYLEVYNKYLVTSSQSSYVQQTPIQSESTDE